MHLFSQWHDVTDPTGSPFLLLQICHIEEGSDVVEDEDYDPNDSFHQVVTTAPRNEAIGQKEEPDTPTFAAHISVERAMHLPWVTEKHGLVLILVLAMLFSPATLHYFSHIRAVYFLHYCCYL